MKRECFFDPKVNKNTVLPSGYNYIGPTYTDSNGTFWNEKGEPTYMLNEVVVSSNSSSSSSFNLGFLYGFGRGIESLGSNNIGTRGKFSGATPGTSIASQYFRYQTSWGQKPTPSWLFKRLPKKVFGTSLRASTQGAVAGRLTPMMGRAFVIGAATMSVYNVATAENKVEAASKEAGGWAGAEVGATLGAEIGAGVGVWFGGVGAVPAAAVGGFIGGAIGGTMGYNMGSDAGEDIYNSIK